MPFKDPEVRRRYNREWYARRRAEWMTGKTCVDCGTDQDLQLDHVDQKQKISHRIWSWSAERRATELEKCVVRCHPCHVRKGRAIGEQRRGFPLEHGNSMYKSRRCRCPVCRADHARVNAAYR